MSRFKQFAHGLRALFRRGQLDADMAEEMGLHLEQRIERNLAAGMSPEEACFAARRHFGNPTLHQENARDARPWAWVDALRRDLIYATRLLQRSPLFAATTVTSLAICLGVNAGIFSILRALVLQPLPFAAANDIVEVHGTGPKVGVLKLTSNLGQYFDYRANAPALEDLALWDTGHDPFTEVDGVIRLPIAVATAEFFSVLRIQPLLGRFFRPEHHVAGNDKVVVLTESFWRTHFGGDPAVIGRPLQLKGASYEIIGVAPRRLESFDSRVKAIRPYSWSPEKELNPSRTSFYVTLLGRIAPGATLADARAQVATLDRNFYDAADIRTRAFIDRTGQTTHVTRVNDLRSAPLRSALWLLQAGAGLVLLIGAINVTHLFLARCQARQREFLTRAALGASRHDLLRQLLVEAGLIGVLGGLGAFGVTWATLHAANLSAAQLLPGAIPFRLGSDVLGLVFLSGIILVGIIAALPALRVLQETHSGPSLQATERGSSDTRLARWAPGALVVGQVAFALILSVGAALLVRSFVNVLAQQPGFNPEQVIAARIDMTGEQEKELPARIEDALAAVPDFDAAVANATPFLPVPGFRFSMNHSGTLSIEGNPGNPFPGVYYCGVPASYARVVGLRLVRGRWFSEAEIASDRAVVVDETFARRYFPGQDPVGRRIARGSPKAPPSDWPEIIGVAANVLHNGAEDRSGVPFTYFSRDHIPFHGSASVLVRTSRPPEEAIALLRRTIHAVDPTIPVYAESTMHGVIMNTVRHRQSIMVVLVAFAGIALLLSALGVFGVLAYNVSRRTHEIGVRVALGASRAQIMGMIVGDGGKKAFLGVLVGTLAALAANRLIASLLFDVAPTDFRAYAGSAGLLLAVALLAAWLPARRAAKVDAMAALRCE